MSNIKMTTEEIKGLMCAVGLALEHNADKKHSKELNDAAAVALRIFIAFVRAKNASITHEQAATEMLAQLSDTMRDESLPTRERLRAAELLGKYYINCATQEHEETDT